MSLYVLKFGGSSVATPARINHVAEIVSNVISHGNRAVVVTSAMQGTTDRLIELTKSFSETVFNREYDAVISAGEQVAAGLLAMALNSIGIPAKSLNAWQIPINAINNHSNAEIQKVNKQKILEEVDKGMVPVITGFQGISDDLDIYTIGRGGSDATACAVANSIDADECLIYTDVAGVYSADPRIVLDAKQLQEVSYDDMIALATWGAKVLQAKSTLIAKRYSVNLKVLSSFSNERGTRVSNTTQYINSNNVTGIAHSLGFALCSIIKQSDYEKSLELTKHFNTINFDTHFLFPKFSQSDLKSILEKNSIEFQIDNNIGTTSLVGNFNVGKDMPNKVLDIAMQNNITVKYKVCSANVISLITSFQETETFVNMLHKEFFENEI